MFSPAATRSEGEYLSSDSDKKATRPVSRKQDSRINRHSRNHSDVLSRRSRSRSRSPYRATRGEKRPRAAEPRPARKDTRTFKVRYEDSRHTGHEAHSGRSSKRSRTYSPSRSRSGSRSPFRHEALASPVPEALQHTNTASVSTEGLETGGLLQSKNGAKTVKQNHTHTTSALLNDGSTTAAADPVPDEAAIIEARRKRREAIKSQYKNQPPSLLVRVLAVGSDTPVESATTTPNRSVSPSPAPISTPTTPIALERSNPSSPMTNLDKDDDAANDSFGSPQHTVDEPSAADYDPTVDMQDERARHETRLFKEDAPIQIKIHDRVREQAAHVAEEAPADKSEFDMFADEDDEDDMFADAPKQKSTSVPTSAKKLDEAMMDNWDDAEGYYLTNLRENIDDRYEVTANLGRGMFASVVRATDTKANKLVAIKIIRNNESMKKAGAKEVDILKDLAANDPDDRKHIVRLLRSFDHKSHLCMVFENLDMNLREVLKKFGRDIGLNIKAIRAYAQQLFLGLSLMKKCQFLHADLKPDNILVDETRMKLKIADLGSASPITENATAPYLVSRFYRAPEVILGIEYDYAIDMWSVGCTLFELYTGKILFTGRNNNGMLKSIMDCRGKFPHKILRKGTLSYEYFDDLLNFRSQEQDKTTGRVVTKMIDIKAKPVRDLRSRLMPKDRRLSDQEKKDVESFADLLDKCLDLRPEKRITPVDALKHPFITKVK